MFMFVPNPLLNIVIWFCIGFILLIVGIMVYFVQEWLRSDWIIWVNKDNTISLSQRIIKKSERILGKIEKGDKFYCLTDAHNSKGFPQWKKIYVFDEGFPVGRMILHRKDCWYSPQTVMKIVNDSRIKMLTKEPIDANTKLFIILGAIAGFLAAIASLVSLAINLGIIKQ